jgi:hypothetical protein
MKSPADQVRQPMNRVEVLPSPRAVTRSRSATRSVRLSGAVTNEFTKVKQLQQEPMVSIFRALGDVRKRVLRIRESIGARESGQRASQVG